MPFPDPCEKCGKPEAEFICLVEGDENWMKSITRKLCSECMHKEYGLIDAWTYNEWVDEE